MSKELYLARLQSTKEVEETGLDATDFIEVLPKSSFNIIAEYDLNNTLSGGTGENCVTPCGMRSECALSFNIRSFGASNPDWCLVAQAAGLHYAIAFGIKTITIQPIMSVQKDLTVWHYDEGCLKKAHNLMFDWEITGEANKPCLINFTHGVGCISTLPIDGTAPAVVKNGSRVKTFTGAICVVLGSSLYQIVSFKFNSNNKLQQKLKCVTYGYGESVLVNREISFEFVAYTELPSVVSPYSAMIAGSETEISFVYGDVDDPITITTQHANIQTVKETSNNGIRIWTISGIITNDDFTLKIGLPVYTINIGAWQSFNNIGAW